MLTRAVRDIAQRFEHRLFLTATPHNGHSNSFAALLELLDPHRFCRGVPVKGPKLLDKVMVRRLKKDLREVTEGFPDRKVVQVDIDGLPEDAPELALARLLDEYTQPARRTPRGRVEDAAGRRRADHRLAAEAAAQLGRGVRPDAGRPQAGHREGRGGQAAAQTAADPESRFSLLRNAPGADDDRAELDDEEVESEADAQVEAATEGREHGERPALPSGSARSSTR